MYSLHREDKLDWRIRLTLNLPIVNLKIKMAVLTAAMFSFVALGASAQESRKGDEFNGYWTAHVRGGVGHTVGETNFSDLLSPAASAGFGYRFSPVFGLRADFTGWQAKGAALTPFALYDYNYVQGTVDAVFDLCNIFAPYKYNRTLNPYLLLGVGGNYAFNNDDATAIKEQLDPDYYWEKSLVSLVGRGGAGLSIRLSDCVDIDVEVNTNLLSDKFNSKPGSKLDFQTNALVGLKFNFGRGRKAKTPVVVAPVPVEKPVVKEEPKAEPKPEPQPEPVVETVVKLDITENVFFTIGKWNISAAEQAKLDKLAEVLSENDHATVLLTGYADAATGTAKRNMFLSEKRAQEVKAYLVSKGVAESRITTDFKGSTVNPYPTPAENRVVICVVE